LEEQVSQLEKTVHALQEWKTNLDEIGSIEEVLYWRSYITRWDTMLHLYSPPEQINLCLVNICKFPEPLTSIVKKYYLK
jgi:hypothetical protein